MVPSLPYTNYRCTQTDIDRNRHRNTAHRQTDRQSIILEVVEMGSLVTCSPVQASSFV